MALLNSNAITNQGFYNRLMLFFVMPVLFVFSIVFANERIYGDSADYLFKIIHHGDFFIAHNRPASVFVEWLPLLMVKLKLPLSYILYGFSIAEFAYFFTWYIVFSRVLKAPPYAIGIVLAYTFGLRWNYFNPVSELITAFPFVFLLAWLWNNTPKNIVAWYTLSLAVAMFVFLSHPLYLLLLPALFGYFYLNNLKERRFIFLGIGILVLAAINYKLLAGYNKMSLEMAQYKLAPADIIKKFFSIATIIDLVKSYAGIMLLLGIVVYSLIKEKKFIRLILAVGFVIGFFGLVSYKYGGYYPDTFEPFERYLFIIPLFICLLAVPYLLQTGKKVRLGLVVLLVWHLFYLGKYGMHIKHRYAVLNNAISNAGQFASNKVYIRAENYYCIMGSARERGHDWVMPTESLLLTSAKGPTNAKQVFVKDILGPEFYAITANDNYMYNYVGWLGNIGDLNPAYMQMKAVPWVEANTDSLQPGFDFSKITVKTYGEISIKAGQTKKVDLTITNTGNVPLYSGMKLQRRGIGYRWVSISTDEVGGYLTPLMCDVLSTVKQEVVITGPSAPGEYNLQIGYKAEKPDTFIPFKSSIGFIRVK